MIDPKQPNYASPPSCHSRALYEYMPKNPELGPLVSIITPYFNTDGVFLETAGSIARQSLQNYEWVIVDDGSTDAASLAQLDRVASQDRRIRVVRQDNAGPAAARNTAFRHSVGRYICLLDSDDLIEPTFLEKCVWFLESNSNFGFCNSWSVNFGDQEFLWELGFERGSQYLEANSAPPMSVIKRQAFAEAEGFDETIRFGHEDWDFWLRLASLGHWGHTLPEYLAWYRKRAHGRFSQVMSTGTTNSDFEQWIALKYQSLADNFPAPIIRHVEPFESVPLTVGVDNPLKRGIGKRILMVYPWLVTGGADKVNLDWITTLTHHGWQVTVCATLESHHDWLPRFASLTPDVFVLPSFLRLVDFPCFLSYLIESRGTDLVMISGSTFGYLMLPSLRSKHPGVAFVDLCHVEEPHWHNGGHPRFGVGYQDLLELNLVTTRHLQEWMVGRGADPSRIEVCYTGIDVSKLTPQAERRSAARESFGLDASSPVIIFAGRLCEQKRPLFLAEILGSLREHGIRFQALIIGDGELKPQLESSIIELGLADNARLLGNVGHDTWLEALAVADAFLLPSLYEGISVALLEAMGMGVVPVTAAVGGQEEVILPDCGFLISHGKDELNAYVDALARLIADETLRSSLGTAARARIVGHFNREFTDAHLVETLNRAVAMAGSKPPVRLPASLEIELATQGVEYTRLSNAASFLWEHWQRSRETQQSTEPPPTSNEPTLPPTPPAIPVRLQWLLERFFRSRLGHWLRFNSVARRIREWLG
jgi:glycosyltransferase involved in cell wall biosynthesis